MSSLVVSYGGVQKRLIVAQGIPPGELAETIKAAFHIAQNIVGFEDRQRATVYPLSLLSLDPTAFPSHAVFSLLLQVDPYAAAAGGYQQVPTSAAYEAAGPGDFGDDDDDEDDDEEEEEEEEPPILEYIQQNTAFSRIPMDEILKVFRKAASEQGVIDRLTFEHCFEKVCRDAGDRQDKKILKLVANKVFDVFDKDGNGIVDHAEFVAGLSLLCRASSDDKIRAAFNLFDLDGDGFVTHDEMLRYMISFFEVCFTLDASMKNKFGEITAEEVGRATANHCFSKADVNKDGNISYEEFRDWCNSDDAVAAGVVGGFLQD